MLFINWVKRLINPRPHLITVIIKPQGYFDYRKYINGSRCYLYDALRKKGFKDVSVFENGNCCINGASYSSIYNFHGGVLEYNFNQGKETKVILIKD